MRNTTLPIMQPDTSPSARKVTRTNLDTLFNALILILNLNDISIVTPDFISLLTAFHNTMISRVDVDAIDAIALYKSLGLWILEFLRGNRLDHSLFNHKDWSPTHSAPYVLIDLIPFISKHFIPNMFNDTKAMLHIQVLYALLSSHRVVVVPVPPAYHTITSKGADVPDYTKDFPDALLRLGITPAEFTAVFRSNCENAKLRVINTAGPNGQATWSAHEDAKAVFSNSVLSHAFQDYSQAAALTWIFDQMVSCVEAPSILTGRKPNDPVVAGRIHAIEEWGGKTRLVAILDYWTQALLTPLHDTVAFFLKRLSADGTFNQDKIITKVKDWTAEKDTEIYSFDLTAATDKLPLAIQRQILKFLLGSDILADNWAAIMSARDFATPTGGTVKYARGQPMGAKSSFPMLGLTHHVITQIAAMRAGLKSYNKYVILGDDNTLTGSDVAKHYLELMAKLDVPVNTSKSVVHGQKLVKAGEICKRIFLNGHELTAIPVKLIVKAQKYGYMASDLQNVFAKRGWALGENNWLTFIAGLVDTRSFQGLVVLNAVPTSVSGLVSAVDVSSLLKIERAWSQTLLADTKALESAFTFALVSEQLKRVDSLLKGTMLMAETIAIMAAPEVEKVWPTVLFDRMTEKERLHALEIMPTLNWSHPIVLAAHYEHERVLAHLSALRSGSEAMVARARSGLLDVLRNSLHEMWLGETERAGIVQRSVFNAAMAAMKKITSVKVESGESPTISFSLLLTHVQRMWSVTWTFGSPVYINAVKSKVNINVTNIESKKAKAFEDFKIADIRL